MSSFKINLANHFAKRSVSKWQPRRALRKVNRKTYRFIMEFGAKDYPYGDPRFAPWPESDAIDDYTLITDSANFVIRRSTSFIAWMMKRYCGSWPKLPVPGERKPGEHKFDAKHWDEVLEFNKWERVPDEPYPTKLDAESSYFIGIIPNEGEFGQLVWLVDVRMKFQNGTTFSWYVRTYKDFKEQEYYIPAEKESGVIWYRGPKKK